MDHTTKPSMVDEHWALLEIVSLKTREEEDFCFTQQRLFLHSTKHHHYLFTQQIFSDTKINRSMFNQCSYLRAYATYDYKLRFVFSLLYLIGSHLYCK